MRPEIREIIASVSKPFRYAGGEVGSITKRWESCDVRVCLAFPEVYELGMSHVGLAILYHLVNSMDGMLAERAFSPWADMEQELRARGMPLFSLESQRSLREFDIIGISLASEFTHTNALNIIDLAGIPLRASERKEHDPLVIAGGPSAFNPMPVAPFFDAIVIGDGEEAILEIAKAVRDAKNNGRRRAALLASLSGIHGVYVPSVPCDRPPGMARVLDLDASAYPLKPIAAYAATQERAAVEVARGCTRGCRFCQAGYTYRPLRQRSQEGAASLACDALISTGREEFSFLSLSIGDWPPLEGALASVHARSAGMPVNATLPSLRVESLTQPVIDRLGSARAGSFTLAPEAATERMRRFINKGNTDDDLYSSVEKVFSSGWRAIKLYFMLGLPGETAAEIDGIAEIANRCLDIGRRYHRRPDVTVSTSTFVPKPHTPLQWERQIGIDETLLLQRELKRRLRRPGISYRWHSAEMSFLEGVFSRGGEELAAAIELAWRKGARFDGWDECFNISLWREVFAECGIAAESYLAERGRDEIFPWDRLGAGPSREFLLRERERADNLSATEDCATGACSGCGICDAEAGLVNRIAGDDTHEVSPVTETPFKTRRGEDGLSGRWGGEPFRRNGEGVSPSEVASRKTIRTERQGFERSSCPESRITVFRYRVRFSKLGRSAFLGHLESLDSLRRGFRAARLPLVYSEGYHPRARIAAGPALPVGVESAAEYADIELSEQLAPGVILEAMHGRLPRGMELVSVEEIAVDAPSIEEASASIAYEIDSTELSEEVCRAISALKGSQPMLVARERKGKSVEVDLRDYVSGLAEPSDGVLGLTVLARQPALKISEILQGLLGISEQRARSIRVRKVSVEWLTRI